MKEKNPKEKSPIGKRKIKQKETPEEPSEAARNVNPSETGRLLSDQNVPREVLDQGSGNVLAGQNPSSTGTPSETSRQPSLAGASPYKKKTRYSSLSSPPLAQESSSTLQESSVSSGPPGGNEKSSSSSSQVYLEGGMEGVSISTEKFYRKGNTSRYARNVVPASEKRIQTYSSPTTPSTSSGRAQVEGTSRQLFRSRLSPDSRALPNIEPSDQSYIATDPSKGAITRERDQETSQGYTEMSEEPAYQMRDTVSTSQSTRPQSFPSIPEEGSQQSGESEGLPLTQDIPMQPIEYCKVEYGRRDSTSPILDPEQRRVASGVAQTINEAMNFFDSRVNGIPGTEKYREELIKKLQADETGRQEQETKDKHHSSPVGVRSRLVIDCPMSMLAINRINEGYRKGQMAGVLSPPSKQPTSPTSVPGANIASQRNVPGISTRPPSNIPGTSTEAKGPLFNMVPLQMLPGTYQFEMPPMNTSDTELYQKIFGMNLGSSTPRVSPNRPQSLQLPLRHTTNPREFAGNQPGFPQSSSISLSPRKQAQSLSPESNIISSNGKRLNVYAKSSFLHANSPTGSHLGQHISPTHSGTSPLSPKILPHLPPQAFFSSSQQAMHNLPPSGPAYSPASPDRNIQSAAGPLSPKSRPQLTQEAFFSSSQQAMSNLPSSGSTYTPASPDRNIQSVTSPLSPKGKPPLPQTFLSSSQQVMHNLPSSGSTYTPASPDRNIQSVATPSPKGRPPLPQAFFSSSQQAIHGLPPSGSRSNPASPDRKKLSEGYTVNDILPLFHTPVCIYCGKVFSPPRCDYPCPRNGIESPYAEVAPLSPRSMVQLSELSQRSSRGLIDQQVVQGPKSLVLLPPGFELLPFNVRASLKPCDSCGKDVCETSCPNYSLRHELQSPSKSETSKSSPESPYKTASNVTSPGDSSWDTLIKECRTSKSPLRRVIRKLNFSSVHTYQVTVKDKKSSRQTHEAEHSGQNVPGSSKEPDAKGQKKDKKEDEKDETKKYGKKNKGKKR